MTTYETQKYGKQYEPQTTKTNKIWGAQQQKHENMTTMNKHMTIYLKTI